MNNPSIAGIQAIIEGRVQGVGFRYFVQYQAKLLNLTGWVRNINNNQVEVFAEGLEPALKIFIQKLQEGPAQARVDSCNIHWLTPTGNFHSFEIYPTQR